MAFTSVGACVPRFMQSVTIDIGNIVAPGSLEVTATVNGLRTDMIPFIAASALNAGLYITGAKISANNTLKFLVQNASGADVNPSSMSFNVIGW